MVLGDLNLCSQSYMRYKESLCRITALLEIEKNSVNVETIPTIYWEKNEIVFFFLSYLRGVTFKLISSSLLVQDQCGHFPFRDCKPFAIHLEEYGCMANLCNYSTLSSLPYSCLTPPPSYFFTLPPPYYTFLPSPPSTSFTLRFNFLCFNTNL